MKKCGIFPNVFTSDIINFISPPIEGREVKNYFDLRLLPREANEIFLDMTSYNVDFFSTMLNVDRLKPYTCYDSEGNELTVEDFIERFRKNIQVFTKLKSQTRSSESVTALCAALKDEIDYIVALPSDMPIKSLNNMFLAIVHNTVRDILSSEKTLKRYKTSSLMWNRLYEGDVDRAALKNGKKILTALEDRTNWFPSYCQYSSGGEARFFRFTAPSGTYFGQAVPHSSSWNQDGDIVFSRPCLGGYSGMFIKLTEMLDKDGSFTEVTSTMLKIFYRYIQHMSEFCCRFNYRDGFGQRYGMFLPYEFATRRVLCSRCSTEITSSSQYRVGAQLLCRSCYVVGNCEICGDMITRNEYNDGSSNRFHKRCLERYGLPIDIYRCLKCDDEHLDFLDQHMDNVYVSFTSHPFKPLAIGTLCKTCASEPILTNVCEMKKPENESIDALREMIMEEMSS